MEAVFVVTLVGLTASANLLGILICLSEIEPESCRVECKSGNHLSFRPRQHVLGRTRHQHYLMVLIG